MVFPWNCDSDWKYQSFDLTQERSPSLNPCLPSDSPTLRPTEVCRGKPQTPAVIGGQRVGGSAADGRSLVWQSGTFREHLMFIITCPLSRILSTLLRLEKKRKCSEKPTLIPACSHEKISGEVNQTCTQPVSLHLSCKSEKNAVQ